MVRRNKNKRRGIQPSVEKHKISGKVDTACAGDPNDRKLLGITVARISRMAEASFTLMCRLSCLTCAQPMEYHSGELFPTSNWKRLCIYYIWQAAVWVFAGIKTVIVIPLLFSDALTVYTLMNIALLFPCMCAGTFGIALVFKPKETVQLVNSWKSTMECLEEPKGRLVSEYEDLALSFKVVGAGYTVVIGLPSILALNFIFPELQLGLHNILLSFGIGHSMPPWMLQTCCLPLEGLLQMLPILNAGLGTCILVIGIDVMKVYYEQLG